MRFMMMFTPANPAPPNPKAMAEMAKYSEEATRSGVLVSTGALLPVGGRLTLAKGKFTEGPLSDAKSVILGWAILEVKSKEEAIEHAKRFMKIVGDGTCEIRQLMDQPAR
jgi:hypothetical protein